MATLCQMSLLLPFFQQHLLTSGLCVTSGNSCNIWNFFVIFVMVIHDQYPWCHYCNRFGEPWTVPIQHGELNKCCVCWLLHQLVVPPSLSLLKPPSPLRHTNIEIRPVNNPTMASKCSSERKGHMSLPLNQKLKIMKLSEESMSKAELGQKLDLLYQTITQAVNLK